MFLRHDFLGKCLLDYGYLHFVIIYEVCTYVYLNPTASMIRVVLFF